MHSFKMKQKEKKKILGLGTLILACLLVLLIAGIGIGYSFFSDSDSKNIEVRAGTLDIEASVVYKLNGQIVTSVDNFNPGDILLIELSVVNSGSKSAWSKLTTTVDTQVTGIDDVLYVFEGDKDSAYCVANKATGKKLTNSTLSFESGVLVVSGDSTKPSPEIETAKTEADYSVLDTNTANYQITLYFDHQAGNAAQDALFELNFLVEAIQYRNNDSSVPSVWV
jgi:hypothetical protein